MILNGSLPSDVQEFINRLNSSVKNCCEFEQTMSYKEAAAKLKAVRLSCKDIIEAIFTGKLSPTYTEASGRIFDLRFKVKDIDALVNNKFAEIKAGQLSLEEVANELRVKMKAIRLWLRRGLLNGTSPGENRQRWWSISRNAIEEFKSQYAIAAPIARFHGMSPGKLVKLLELACITAISGPAVDNGLQYLYLKSDIERAGYDTSVDWDTSDSYRCWIKGINLKKQMTGVENNGTCPFVSNCYLKVNIY